MRSFSLYIYSHVNVQNKVKWNEDENYSSRDGDKNFKSFGKVQIWLLACV